MDENNKIWSGLEAETYTAKFHFVLLERDYDVIYIDETTCKLIGRNGDEIDILLEFSAIQRLNYELIGDLNSIYENPDKITDHIDNFIKNKIMFDFIYVDGNHKFDYVFTSGAIGPTHDDITSESISKAFDDVFEKNLIAEKILIQHYGAENINEARLKMAYMPRSATLLENSLSSAPGFRVGNVFVMAGIPKIFQVMFEVAKSQLKVGKKIIARIEPPEAKGMTFKPEVLVFEENKN